MQRKLVVLTTKSDRRLQIYDTEFESEMIASIMEEGGKIVLEIEISETSADFLDLMRSLEVKLDSERLMEMKHCFIEELVVACLRHESSHHS